MKESRCLAHCNCHSGRREFIKKSALMTAGAFISYNFSVYAREKGLTSAIIKGYGEASGYIPKIKAAFVRRKEEYGMLWPGAVYDGDAARKKYTEELKKASGELGLSLDLREDPIYNSDEADLWLAQARESAADGLLLLLLDRQQHAWPTAQKSVESGIPAVIFSPLCLKIFLDDMRASCFKCPVRY